MEITVTMKRSFKERERERESEDVTHRLSVIRKYVVGDNQAEFARRLGITPSRWNNLERGWPLSMQVALMLVNTVDGLTMSYITHGLTGDMPKPLARQLSLLKSEMFPPSLGKRPPSK